jgi:hypothetical protein
MFHCIVEVMSGIVVNNVEDCDVAYFLFHTIEEDMEQNTFRRFVNYFQVPTVDYFIEVVAGIELMLLVDVI